MSRVVKFLALTLIVALAAGLVGCAETQYQPGGSSPTPPAETGKKIIITYSSNITNKVGEREWQKADPGYTYLILDLDIENQGYESFSTGRSAFSVVVSNVGYDVTYVGLDDMLKVVDLLDGGRITGKLAFEVPEDVTDVGYQVRYESVREYNIQGIKR